jgi:hypothetical protein
MCNNSKNIWAQYDATFHDSCFGQNKINNPSLIKQILQKRKGEREPRERRVTPKFGW